jgi:hypothetical protein
MRRRPIVTRVVERTFFDRKLRREWIIVQTKFTDPNLMLIHSRATGNTFTVKIRD